MFFRELPEKLLDVYTAARLDLKADFVGRSAIETMQRVQEPYRSLLFWLLDLAVRHAISYAGRLCPDAVFGITVGGCRPVRGMQPNEPEVLIRCVCP